MKATTIRIHLPKRGFEESRISGILLATRVNPRLPTLSIPVREEEVLSEVEVSSLDPLETQISLFDVWPPRRRVCDLRRSATNPAIQLVKSYASPSDEAK